MQFPDRTADILFHQNAARRASRKGDYAAARMSYFKWVESVRQQNIRTGGNLDGELEAAKNEYSDFVRSDPLFQTICQAAISKIVERPGILQTELYNALPEFGKSDIQYAMYFASEHESVVRTKKGRSYSLSVPKQPLRTSPRSLF